MTEQINAADHLGLVATVIHEFLGSNARAFGDYDDVFQEGCLALVRAAREFDSALGAKFSTFAGVCIRSKVRNFIRDKMAKKRFLPPQGSEQSALDVIGDNGRETYDGINRRLDVESAIQKTSETDRSIFAMRVDERLDWREIGRRSGMSKDAAQMRFLRLVKRVINTKQYARLCA